MRGAALILALLCAGGAAAQTAAPLAGEDRDEISVLGAAEIAGLRAGAGLGYARAAELNGWPGPLHVLEEAEALELSPEVRTGIEAIRAAMLAEAVPLGEALIAAHRALDAVFDGPDPDAAQVAAATARLGEIEARLRAVHLTAHLATAPLLTRHQRMLYARARGYSDAGHSNGGPGAHAHRP